MTLEMSTTTGPCVPLDTQAACEPLRLIMLLTLKVAPRAAPVDKAKEIPLPDAVAV